MSESLGLPWTPEELEIVEEAYDRVEAWENYRARFGNVRSMGAIATRWYRAHPKRPELEDLLRAFIQNSSYIRAPHILELLDEYQAAPDALVEKGIEQGWWKP